MKGMKVRTLREIDGRYEQGSDAIITGGICFSIPFLQSVDYYEGDDGIYHDSIEIEVLTVHFYNGLTLTIPKTDF